MAGGAQEADDAITGINVTPLVDITLVLLIIFMVTTKIVLDQTRAARPAQGGHRTSDVQTVFSIILAADGRAVVDRKPDRQRRRILPLARSGQARTRTSARHQGRLRGHPRAGHPRAGFAEAGARVARSRSA